MKRLLDGIDSAVLLQHVPSNVRMSLETLERAGTDWNDVGGMLSATPTVGVSVDRVTRRMLQETQPVRETTGAARCGAKDGS